jgi:hypothetical protein
MKAGTPAAPLAALLGLISCGPETAKMPVGDESRRYAEAVCGAMQDCGCAPHFGEPQACVSVFNDRFSQFLADEYVLDLDCFDRVVDSDDLADCGAADAAPTEWSCTVLSLHKGEGDDCSDHQLELPPFAVSECDSDLLCIDGVCVPHGTVGPPLAEGDECFSEQAASCHVGGLYCSGEGVCEVEPGEGEPCSSPFACSFEATSGGGDLYCSGWSDTASGTCTRQATTGDSCDPFDWGACTQGADFKRGWCDPETQLCEADGPGICLLTDYPGARALSR